MSLALHSFTLFNSNRTDISYFQGNKKFTDKHLTLKYHIW